MAMGSREVEQAALFLTAGDWPEAPTLPFVEKLNEVLAQAGPRVATTRSTGDLGVDNMADEYD